MILWRNYPSIIKQFHNTACTLQWCVTVKLCRYHANRAPKTGDHQAHNPTATNGTTSRRNDNSRYRQRRKSRQFEDPLLSMRKGNEYNNDMAEKLSKHKNNYIKISCTFQRLCITVKSGVNIMLIELRKTKDRQADSPTGGTAICRTTNHDANNDE